ncbi:hypothetical protein [uncultured Tenacibaculum sp.]|uniref:hypothetical protein n=1 Tax=uncultured Tenacibaculum sp. TaxID=174713 RepID=UPI0026245025|nr:hypothetical protein [uncultured Tenacibaculum sp.]
MKKKLFIITLSIGLIGLFLYYLAWLFSPGSYAKAERYVVPVSEEVLITIINEVKAEHPEIAPQPVRYSDGKHTHWHSTYFQYQDNRQHIHTWTRKKNKTHTTFAFVGYKGENSMEGWIAANAYFWWWKNAKAKRRFETRILHKIKEKIKVRGL